MSDWTWQMLDAQGAPIEHEASATVFPTQSEAESWLGEEWHELLESGIDSVSLREDGEQVYGPMSLHATQ